MAEFTRSQARRYLKEHFPCRITVDGTVHPYHFYYWKDPLGIFLVYRHDLPFPPVTFLSVYWERKWARQIAQINSILDQEELAHLRDIHSE